MSSIYHFFGNLFGNYAVFIIVFVLITRLVSIPLNKISKKQTIEKQKREAKYKEFEKECNGDREELSNKIYEYYKNSNFNPYTSFISKFLIIVLNIVIVFAIVGCFSPLKNFSSIPENEVQNIVNIYKEETKTKRYPEITMLSDVDSTAKLLKNKGIKSEYINEIKNTKEKFKIFGFDTTQVPKYTNELWVKVLPYLVVSLLIIRTLITILFQIVHIKDKKKLTMLLASTLPSTLLSVGFSIALSIYTPVIVCIYLMILYISSLISTISSLVKKGGSNNETKNDTEENSSESTSVVKSND